MKRITYLLIPFLLWTVGATQAQTTEQSTPNVDTLTVQPTPDTAHKLTLHECMEIAVRNSSKMKLQTSEIDDARLMRRQAILNTFTPHFEGGTSGNFNFGRTVDPETNTYKSITSFSNGYYVGGSLTLFDGFSAVNNMKITKTALKMGLQREEQLREEICLATMEAFYNVVFSEELVEVLTSFVETAKQNLHLANRQKELGQKGYADVVQFEAELADREYELVNAQNQQADALLTLKDMMLWAVDEPLEVDTSLLAPSLQMRISYGEMAEKARLTMPSVLMAEGKMDNALRELRTAKWSLLPSLSMSGGWSTSFYTLEGITTDNFKTQFKSNRGEYVQFNLSIPIFSGLFKRAKVSKAKHAFARAEIEYRQTLHDVDQEVARAIQEHEGARVALTQAERRSSVQEEAYRLNKSKLERGLISPLEFQTASNLYLKSRAERMDAELKYRLKQSVVRYYQGESYLEQN